MPDPAHARPHAIVIDDWQAFCRLLDQDQVDDTRRGHQIRRSHLQWQEIAPAPVPAFPALLAKGRGFNILVYSQALESWLKEWGIPFSCRDSAQEEARNGSGRVAMQASATSGSRSARSHPSAFQAEG